jgi:nickel/cobalt transporter (NicO) family protein
MTAFTRALLMALALLLAPGLVTQPAGAQAPAAPSQPGTSGQPSAPAKSFLPPRAAATKDAAPAPPSGLFGTFYVWIADKQRQFIATLAAALRDIKAGNVLGASLVLIGFSFAYGVLHAAGPGHGKAVVSSYILADGQTVRRGVHLAFLSAFVQALSALLIFSVVVLALKGARTQIVNTEAWIERISWLIVAGFGAWLLWRQLAALLRPSHAGHGHAHGHAGPSARAHGAAHHGHDHTHHDHKHHEHAHAHHHDSHAAHASTATGHKQGHAHHVGHTHHHGHAHAHGDHCDACGHAHMPSAAELKGDWSWKRAAGMALAIGMRPCTGAIGVLFVANGLGLMWAGVASTFAMAVGTAITVSVLAALAASSRDAAAKLAGVADNTWAARAQTAFGLAGAALVFLLGASFFYYSLNAATPF